MGEGDPLAGGEEVPLDDGEDHPGVGALDPDLVVGVLADDTVVDTVLLLLLDTLLQKREEVRF